MKWDPVNRRQFLRGAAHGLGQITVGLPLLASLLPREARAAGLPAPRLVVMGLPHGSLYENRFFSSRIPVNVVTRPDGSTYRHEPLANFYTAGQPFDPGAIAPHVLSPLNAFKAKVNVVKGLDIPYYLGHHRFGPMLGHPLDNDQGSAVNGQLVGRPTIDQYLAERIYPANFSGYKSLVFGSSMSFNRSQPGNATTPVIRMSDMGDNALNIYRAIFGIYDSPNLTIPTQTDLLNFVYQDYLGLRNHARISGADRQMLDAHMTMLSDLRTRIMNPPSGIPAAPGTCESAFATSACTNEQKLLFDYQTQNSIIAAAIRTGMTRVATKYISRYLFGGDYWHDHAHNANQTFIQDEFQTVHRWFIQNVYADLLAKLDIPEENGRTFLDNSLVILHHEHSWTHSLYSVPTLIAGDGAGAIRTGTYIDYTDQRDLARTSPNSQYWNDPYSRTGIYVHQLQNTILSAFGIPLSQYQIAPGHGYMETLNLADSRYVGGSGNTPRTSPTETLPYIKL